MTSDLRIISATSAAASSRSSLTSTALLLKIGRKKNKSHIINNKKRKTMNKKIDMAMPLNDLPFIWDRERTIKILNDNLIYTVEDLISYPKNVLETMGISSLTIVYLESTLATAYLYFREENEDPKTIESANLTPELWERRRYEVAKEVFINQHGTYNISDGDDDLNEDIYRSIRVATAFIDKLKEVSEIEMSGGDWK